MRARLTTVLAVSVLALLGAILWLAQPAQPIVFPAWYPLTNDDGDAAFADFENHTPCDVDQCDRLKFGIVLYRDAAGEPTTYLMSRVHVAVSDDRTVNIGTWSIEQGTALDPDATVYRLNDGAPAEFDLFWAIGDDILFILDEDRAPRVGDAAYGFALNRVPIRPARP
jgi:hypothetical protein